MGQIGIFAQPVLAPGPNMNTPSANVPFPHILPQYLKVKMHSVENVKTQFYSG